MIENLNKLIQLFKSSRQASKAVISILLFSLTSGCSTYKSSWDCPKAKGIGCSSLEYADEMAREQILLNTSKHKKTKPTNQGTKKGSQASQVLLNQDLLSSEEYELIEIE